MINSVQDTIENRARRGLRRPFSAFSFCSGMLAEGFAAAALGIPMEDMACADKDTTAQAFIMKFHRHRVSHVYDSMAAFSFEPGKMVGHCYRHGKQCSEENVPRDAAIGGSPCQPFSRSRASRFTSSAEMSHPLYAATFGDSDAADGSVIETLKNQQPSGGVLEQVAGFGMKAKAVAQSSLDLFIEQIQSILTPDGKQLYTGVVALQVDASCWLEILRPRTLANTTNMFTLRLVLYSWFAQQHPQISHFALCGLSSFASTTCVYR
jgi:site-specific DNA-cytosine methylase